MDMRKRKRAACARYFFGLRVAALFAELAEAAEILREALEDMDDAAALEDTSDGGAASRPQQAEQTRGAPAQSEASE